MSIQSFHVGIPSISQMSPEELDQVVSCDGIWKQDRELFHNLENVNSMAMVLGYVGSYENAIDGGACNAGKIFKKTMSHLTQDDIYLDIGAGNGRAILEYKKAFPNRAHAIGVALTKPAQPNLDTVIQADKEKEVSFYVSDFKHFPTETLKGRVSVITDIHASFQYGLDPSGVIRKMGELLKPGGLAFIRMGEEDKISLNNIIDTVIPRTSIPDQRIEKGSGTLMKVWFLSIQGFKVIGTTWWTHNEYKTQTDFLAAMMENPDEMRDSPCGDPNVMILARTEEDIQVDPLIPRPGALDIPYQANYDSLLKPLYTWQYSERSKELLGRVKLLIH